MTNRIAMPPTGKYIIAVSGGVDSVVLLDLLRNLDGLDLVVAHYNHGIRDDSDLDEEFVGNIARSNKYIFETAKGNLGPDASEDLARQKRYEFLEIVKQKHQALAVITAHHQDDIIETCFINLVRGTGRRGISSLSSKSGLYRPLLSVSKEQLINYAKEHNIKWREDKTNKDTKFLRNNIRINVLAKMSPTERADILKIIDSTRSINEKIDKELAVLLHQGLHKNQNVMNRSWFIQLPHDVSKEVIYAILNKMKTKEIDRKSIEKIVVSIKTFKPGKIIDAAGLKIYITKRSARFVKL